MATPSRLANPHPEGHAPGLCVETGSRHPQYWVLDCECGWGTPLCQAPAVCIGEWRRHIEALGAEPSPA